MKCSIAIPAATIVSVLCCGCSSDSHVIEDSETTFTTPTKFEESDVTWSKVKDMAESDTEQLTDYFQDNPSVSENPIVEGDPLIYSSSSGTKRYYWVRAGAEEAEWFCLDFGDDDVEVLSGSGQPFHSDSTAS